MPHSSDFKPYFSIFQHQPNLVYLDSAATALKPDSVIAAERAYEEEYSANIGRGLYPIAEMATSQFEAVREQTARFIGAEAREIIFTKNTTDSINTSAALLAERLRPGDNIVITEAEHHANFLPWVELARRKNVDLRIAPFQTNGSIDQAALLKLIDTRTAIVAFGALSNVFGAINPVADIVRAIRNSQASALIIVDAAQAIGHIPIETHDWDADCIAFSAHKTYGPTGVGILYGRAALLETLAPVAFGGGMVLDACANEPLYKGIPYRFEAGTPNISGVIGWGAALSFLEAIGLDRIREHESSLAQSAIKRLTAAFGDTFTLLGPTTAEQRGGLVSFTLDGIHPHDLAQILGEHSICIRAGEHCAAPLHRRLNLPATARVSFGVYNTEEDIDRLIEAMEKAQEILNPKLK